MVFEAVCKTLLWWSSGANVVHFIDIKIRKRLVFSFLRIIFGDPFGILPKCCVPMSYTVLSLGSTFR